MQRRMLKTGVTAVIMFAAFAVGGLFASVNAGDFETCHAYAMDWYDWAYDFTGGDEEAATAVGSAMFESCMAPE